MNAIKTLTLVCFLMAISTELSAAAACESCHKEKHRIHSVRGPFREAKRPSDFPIEAGQMTCSTCHYPSAPCVVGNKSGEKAHDSSDEGNKFLLRGGPYEREEDFCFVCHPQYRKLTEPLDPHDLKTEAQRAKCLLCHNKDPFVSKPTEQRPDLKFSTNLLCLQCHSKTAHNDSRHVAVKLSPQMLSNIQKVREELHFRLAVTESGEMSCSTCHNPHFTTSIPMIKTKTFEHALRMPAENAEVCHVCHEEKIE